MGIKVSNDKRNVNRGGRKEMTLIVLIKYRQGYVLASDTRVMWGLTRKKDGQSKVIKINDEVALAAAGLIGAIDDVKKDFLSSYSNVKASFDEMVGTLSNLVFTWWNNNKMKFEGEETRGPDFAIASPDISRVIFGNGYSEEVRDYHCEGSGSNYGEFILQNAYLPDMERERAKELAVYTIVETSKIDPTVGGEVSMILCDKEMGLVSIPKREIETISSQFPRNIFAVKTESQKAEQIVVLRDEVNNLFESKFHFRLFAQQERVILELHKSCRNEEEFSLLVSSLAALVDNMDTDGLRKLTSESDKNKKSIGLLDELLQSKGGSKTITDRFRKIRILRSAHYPIHPTESEFIQLVLELEGKYPPDWSLLWNHSLDLYIGALQELKEWIVTLGSSHSVHKSQ